jgi:hypothetical protein
MPQKNSDQKMTFFLLTYVYCEDYWQILEFKRNPKLRITMKFIDTFEVEDLCSSQ